MVARPGQHGAEVASRELRNRSRELLDRAAAGETVTITDRGKPVAVLAPVDRRPTFISRELFQRSLSQADPGMSGELLDLLGGETTDDLPLP
jgi:prevent-host-death family protein